VQGLLDHPYFLRIDTTNIATVMEMYQELVQDA